MLGAEYTAFRASYNEPNKRGIRLNTVKCTKEQLERVLPFITGAKRRFRRSRFMRRQIPKWRRARSIMQARFIRRAVRVFGRHAFGAGTGG